MNKNNEDQEYRAPLPIIRTNLMMGDMPKLSEYIREINERDDLDDDMKQIMIDSRKEYLELNRPDLIDNIINHCEDTNIDISQNSVIKRANDIVNFVSKIDSITNKNFVTNIKNKLNDYVSCKKDFIKLDPENYIIYENILPSLDLDSQTLNYIGKIIVPYDIQLLEEYKTAVELSKIEFEKTEEIKKIKEQRRNILQIMLTPMAKILKFDPNANELYKQLLPLINSYIELEIDQIKVEQNLLNKTINFIDSVRINDEQRNLIKQIFIS